jgi:hypothetical protein
MIWLFLKNTKSVACTMKRRRPGFFSVVDIIQALIQQPDFQTARKYWNKLKERLKKEGSESVTKYNRLKLEAVDGKKYLIIIVEESDGLQNLP